MTSIKYGSLKIEKISSSSGLFIGTNIQKGRKSETLTNEGFGTIKGIQNNVKTNTGILKKNS
jgi:hypothetical protein